MKKTNDLEQLGEDTVAKAIAKAEGTTMTKAKAKLNEAKEKYVKNH